jgi:hypothetical protein
MSSSNIVGYIYKAPAEEFSFDVDFSPWMTDGDTIASHSVAVIRGVTDYATTMVAASSDDSDDQVTVTIQGGTARYHYSIEITVTTVAGDVWLAIVYLTVN